jgi:hypothetical protein
MLEVGVFHNGASSLPVITTKDGVTLNDGSLAQVHQAAQETLVNRDRASWQRSWAFSRSGSPSTTSSRKARR